MNPFRALFMKYQLMNAKTKAASGKAIAPMSIPVER
jgi:hypothetical protein